MARRNPTRTALAVLALSIGLSQAVLASPAAAQAVAAEPTSETGQELSRWVTASGDNRDLPFIVIDKVAAEVLVFDADGELLGATAALLGSARGDDSVPGIGERKLEAIRPDERTTPAGRFVSSFGPAAGKGDAFWVDYATAISLHPVPTANPKERRAQRLRTRSPDDNRITYGCINVAAAFYSRVIRKTFVGTRGVVYILPETRSLDEVFPTFRLQGQADAAGYRRSQAADRGAR
jgi:hypothetical protein